VLSSTVFTANPGKVNNDNVQDQTSESIVGRSGGNENPRAVAIASLTSTLNALTAVGDVAGARVILQTISTLLATDDGAPSNNVVELASKRRDGTR
jgi:hypothetical protein